MIRLKIGALDGHVDAYRLIINLFLICFCERNILFHGEKQLVS
jgi:hypothetical protein